MVLKQRWTRKMLKYVIAYVEIYGIYANICEFLHMCYMRQNYLHMRFWKCHYMRKHMRYAGFGKICDCIAYSHIAGIRDKCSMLLCAVSGNNKHATSWHAEEEHQRLQIHHRDWEETTCQAAKGTRTSWETGQEEDVRSVASLAT